MSEYLSKKAVLEQPGNLEQLDVLQERLDRVAAIVDVIEQHDSLDATTLTQLRLALSWVPDGLPDESQV